MRTAHARACVTSQIRSVESEQGRDSCGHGIKFMTAQLVGKAQLQLPVLRLPMTSAPNRFEWLDLIDRLPHAGCKLSSRLKWLNLKELNC